MKISNVKFHYIIHGVNVRNKNYPRMRNRFNYNICLVYSNIKFVANKEFINFLDVTPNVIVLEWGIFPVLP